MNIFGSLYDLLSGSSYLAYFLCLLSALVGGFLLAFTYRQIKKGFAYVKFMPLTILFIPLAMAALVGMLNLRNAEIEASDTIKVGVVLTAGVALTRFRSDKLAIEDMLYLVLASVVGIALGIGYVAYGLLSLLGAILLLFLAHHFRFGEDMGGVLSVRIQVPEELNRAEVFEQAFALHCQTYHLGEVRTVEYGQLYELRYDVCLKKGDSIKALMDELRLHNGNLEVVVSDAERQ